MGRCFDRQGTFPLFRLPKELRLTIYEFTLHQHHTGSIHIGYGDLQPIQPSLIRACSILRREALPVYFATCDFILNLHNTRGCEKSMKWARVHAHNSQNAFNHLRHITLLAGSLMKVQSANYVVDLHLRQIVSTWYQKPCRTGSLPLQLLETQLREVPDRCEVGFDMCEQLRVLIEVLFRASEA